MNNRKRKKLIDKLQGNLRNARINNNYIEILRLSQEIEKLQNEIVQVERTTYGELTKDTMTKNEINVFTADVISMIVASDILVDYAMRVEKHTRKYSEFSSSHIMKVKQAISLLNDIVHTIDDIGHNKRIRNENGEVVTFTDHYSSIVDEVESQLFGWRNVINKIVTKRIGLNK